MARPQDLNAFDSLDNDPPTGPGLRATLQPDAQLGPRALKDVSSADTAVEALGSGRGLSLTRSEGARLPGASSRSENGPLARDVEGGAVLVDPGGCVVPPFSGAPLGPGTEPVEEPLRRVGSEQ
jgi:hypothetical protein